MPATTFLVSFPRSGSNFLQNVLNRSGLGPAGSIYVPDQYGVTGRNFKSHAPTPEYLQDEAYRLLGHDLAGSPCPVLWLTRDPRDAMISFYEYSRHRLQCELDQGLFCHGFDWFLAAPIDRACMRRVMQQPLTVMEAFTLHCRSWMAEACKRPGSRIRFEDLVMHPEATFADAARALDMAPPQDMRGLEQMVAQFSDDARPRGRPFAWQSATDHYAAIIAAVETAMGAEIDALGYA